MRVEGSYCVYFFSSNIAGSLSTLATESLSDRQSYSPSDVTVVTTGYTAISSAIRQSTSEQSKLSTLTTVVQSSQNRSFTTTFVSMNKSATSSVLVQSSSKVQVVTTSYMALSITPRSSTLGQSALLTMSAPSVDSSQSTRFTATAATRNASRPLTSEILSASEVLVGSTRYMALLSTLLSIPFSSALQTTSGASMTSATPSSRVLQLMTANRSVGTSPSQSYTIVVSVNVSATPSSQINQSSEFTAFDKSSSTITSSASAQTVVVTPTSRLGISQSQTFATASVQATTTTAIAPSVNLSTKASSQMIFSSDVTVSVTGSTPMTQSSSVAFIPPVTFVRFVISVPLNQSVTDISFKANLTRGILTAYENGTLDGLTGNVSVNVSKSLLHIETIIPFRVVTNLEIIIYPQLATCHCGKQFLYVCYVWMTDKVAFLP